MAKRFIIVQTHKKTWRAGRLIEESFPRSLIKSPIPVYELLQVRFNDLNRAVQTVENVDAGNLPIWELGAVR